MKLHEFVLEDSHNTPKVEVIKAANEIAFRLSQEERWSEYSVLESKKSEKLQDSIRYFFEVEGKYHISDEDQNTTLDPAGTSDDLVASPQ